MSAAANTFSEVTGTDADRYRAILQSKIASGARLASSVIEQIHTAQPSDRIVRAASVVFQARDNGAMGVAVGIADDLLAPSEYALGQLGAKAGVPTAYLRELATGAPWQRELASTVLSRHYANTENDSRMLARSVGTQLRGWLSDRYRRLDSRPLVDALASEATAFGAVPIDGTATETRVALKIVFPEIVEPLPGEFLVYGGEWSNSDYGNGTHAFRSFALRVVCLNGMTRENLLREIHLGGRLSDQITYSDRTMRLDTAASVSALRDVVRGSLGPAGRDVITAGIRAAHERAMTAKALGTAVASKVTKATAKAIVDAFDSQDVINLPAGKTAWRASNAVSWIARHTGDAEARLDLERLAGSLGGEKSASPQAN